MGAASSSSWSVRELLPNDSDFLSALHLAVTARPDASNSSAAPVRDLLESGTVGELRLRPVVGAFEGHQLRMAVVGVESPGASNLFLIPFELDSHAQLQGGLLCLRSALELSTNCGIRFSQAIGPEHPSKWDVVLREAGFTRLTHLVYLTRKVASIPSKSGKFQLASGQRWLTYSAQTESLFCEAIAQSYVQSMDCPELTNVRTARESLSAHRAVGEFNPATWFALVADDRPQGVLLLSKVRREPVMEIVYMGASQLVRRSGVADLLMDQALRAAASHASSLILAVDVRNTPAIRLYTRWNFVEIARRAAWIASPYSIRR